MKTDQDPPPRGLPRWRPGLPSRLRRRLDRSGAFAPEELRRWRKRIGKLERRGEFDAALEEARRMAARSPRSPYVHLAVAELYLRHGHTDAAASAFRKAWQVTPKRRLWKVAPRFARGLGAAGRSEEALELLGTLDGTMAPGPLGVERARLQRQLGRDEEAIEELMEALRKNSLYEPASHDLIELLDSVGRSDEAEAVRRRHDALPPRRSAAEVVEAIAAHVVESSRYVVNIGCGDGKTKDPCYELFRQGYPGLAVDAVEHPRLRRNLPYPDVRKVLGTPLTPANVVDVLRQAGCPRAPILLKIDIDSFDGPLLEAVLAGFEPDVIHIEVNPDFPPPLKFAIQYDPRYSPSGRAGFFGCSVAYVTSISRPAGYELLQIDFSHPTTGQDAILVKRQYLALFGVEAPVDERELFLKQPFGGWRGLAEIGIDTEAWRAETDFQSLLEKAREACVAASVYRTGTVHPFHLSL
jgi:tetratricopeptide (TPR) repeat protein